MPNAGNIKFLYGTQDEYQEYTSSSEHPLDSNSIYFITDKHLILIEGESYTTRPETMIYLGHYSDLSQVPDIDVDIHTPTYACTIGDDNILYVININRQLGTYEWSRFSKLNADDVFDKLGDYIVSTISDSVSDDNKIPSVKAVKDLVESKTDSKAGQAGGLATLDPNGKIPSSQLPFEIDTAIDKNSTNPVENRVIAEALDNKVDKDGSKQLSTKDFTEKYEIKLQNLRGSGTVIQSDWSEASPSSSAYIKNKPNILGSVPAVGSQEYQNSGHLVSAKAVRDAINSSGITVDSEIDQNSINPVQNRAIYSEIGKITDKLDDKVDKEDGKVLSDNNFTTELKDKLESLSGEDKFTETYQNKLDSIEYGAQVNVHADWNAGTDTFEGDGSTAVFTLSKNPEQINYVLINDVEVSEEGYTYKMSENTESNVGTVTLNNIPEEGSTIIVGYDDPAKILNKPDLANLVANLVPNFISLDDGIVGSVTK